MAKKIHAFLITAYTDFDSLKALLESLASSQCYFFINIDKKSILNQKEIIDQLYQIQNVIYIHNSLNVNYASYNHLLAYLLLLKKAKAFKTFDYYHSITGQCYPIKPLPQILSFFENHNENFIEFVELPTDRWGTEGGLDRLKYFQPYELFDVKNKYYKYHSAIIRILLSLQRKSGFSRLKYNKLNVLFPKFFGGWTYWSLTKEAINYILQFLDSHPKLLQKFKFTFCPEEIFFQMILLNSPLKESIINGNLRFVDWHDRNNSYPAVLDTSDYGKLFESECLFGRKFDSVISKELRNLVTHGKIE